MNAAPKIIVVDGFYPDPDAVRRWGLGHGYRNAARYSYPGWQSTKALATDALAAALAETVGTRIRIDGEKFTFGGFRLMTARSGRMTKVHADAAADWAGLVYLMPRASPACGTGFFRHRGTGAVAPPSDRDARRLGYSDAAEFERLVIRPDAARPDAWELLHWIAPVYNRLILFRGCEMYHAPLGGMGSEPGDARLTHNFFFDEIPAVGLLTLADVRSR